MGSVSGEGRGESWDQCVGRGGVSHGISVWRGQGESWDLCVGRGGVSHGISVWGEAG